MPPRGTGKPSHPRPSIPVALMLLAIGGCLIHQSSDVHRSGIDVPEPTFAQIKPGETTAGWVKATLGDPSAREPNGPDGEVWRYDYTEKVDSSGYVFLIFGGSNTTETKRKAVVEFQNGVVTRKWRG